MQQTKQILINTISSWFALFATAVVMIFLTKFLVNRLGVERFGMFRYVATIQGSLMFLDLGLGATLNRFISRFLAVKDYERLNSAASFGLLMFLIMGIFALVVMVGVGFILPKLVTGSSSETYADGFMLMCCFAGMIMLRFLGYSARGLLFGSQRYDVVNGIQAGGAILRALLITVTFVSIPSSNLMTIGLCYLSSSMVEAILLWLFVKYQIPTLRVGISLITRETIKQVLHFGAFVFIIAVTTMLIWNMPIFLAGKFLGAQAVAFLSFSLLLIEQVQRLAGGFGFSLIPVAGKYDALGEMGKLQSLAIKGTKYCALLCFPVGILATIFGHPIFEWFKEGFGWTWALMGILMIPYLIRMTQRPVFSVLVGAKSIRELAIGQILLVIMVGVFAWLFGDYFKMGLYGIVIGTSIPIFFFNTIWQTKYACKQLELKWGSYMWQSYGRVALSSIPTAVAAIIIMKYAYPKNLFSIIIEGTICMLVFAVFAWYFVLSGGERKQVFLLLPNLQRKTEK